jgi:lipid II isoglutaminyl synthase (glutamine-hydrolysing)
MTNSAMSASTPVGIGLVRPDLLGTYGDAGNATVLAQRLRWRGRPAEIVPLGPGADIPANVQVLVIGGGEDRSQLALLDDQRLLANLLEVVEQGAAVLGVCAGLQLLGNSFTGSDGRQHNGLGLLDCTSDRLEHRAVGECITEGEAGPLAAEEIVLTGFENHLGRTVVGPGSAPLGRVITGVGNGDGTDGAVSPSGRIVGTYLHGPVLARNPALADWILESVLGELPELHVPVVERLRRERIAAARRPRRRSRPVGSR